jgi:ElaB/YqjD/DUF883 family membrane-anchored ribosome-binding protein
MAADIDKIRGDIASLKDDFARVVKDLASNAKGEISDETKRLYAKLSQQSERSAKRLAREVEERPLTTLLLAFGIGFIGGSLMRR